MIDDFTTKTWIDVTCIKDLHLTKLDKKTS